MSYDSVSVQLAARSWRSQVAINPPCLFPSAPFPRCSFRLALWRPALPLAPRAEGRWLLSFRVLLRIGFLLLQCFGDPLCVGLGFLRFAGATIRVELGFPFQLPRCVALPPGPVVQIPSRAVRRQRALSASGCCVGHQPRLSASLARRSLQRGFPFQLLRCVAIRRVGVPSRGARHRLGLSSARGAASIGFLPSRWLGVPNPWLFVPTLCVPLRRQPPLRFFASFRVSLRFRCFVRAAFIETGFPFRRSNFGRPAARLSALRAREIRSLVTTSASVR